MGRGHARRHWEIRLRGRSIRRVSIMARLGLLTSALGSPSRLYLSDMVSWICDLNQAERRKKRTHWDNMMTRLTRLMTGCQVKRWAPLGHTRHDMGWTDVFSNVMAPCRAMPILWSAISISDRHDPKEEIPAHSAWGGGGALCSLGRISTM
ncbi:hypothetical protein NW755_14963 [Fusarium falciforme]|uniref:Uncharacterized protein n=1 Tax=Fusarium falciforme TaxID=195108 RepID=A0A9W8V5C9_9HYPO|nr:hypothetical protein NW755_14963 [Fusarium falciforme]